MLQAEARDKERQREESRKQRKLDSNLRSLLKAREVDTAADWDAVRESLADDPAFTAITVEADRIRVFKVRCVVPWDKW